MQPHSGTQANQAVLLALLQPGDTHLSMSLVAGGHFSHGEPRTLAGKWFQAQHYGVDPQTHLIDYEEVQALAQQHRPQFIIAGASAYPRTHGIPLLTGGTDVPFLIADLRPLAISASPLVSALDSLNIGCNAAPVAGDSDFAQARGLRLGVSALTTRGMREVDCGEIASLIAGVADAIAQGQKPAVEAADTARTLARRFPLSSHSDLPSSARIAAA